MMKKILYYSVILFLLVSACKKDNPVPKKAFEDITLADIQQFENQFSNNNTIVSDDTGKPILKSGSIIFYKTTNGDLGKFKISGISAQNVLSIDLINFDNNGSVVLDKSAINIQSGYACDLDQGIQTISAQIRDFDWEIAQLKKVILPANTAVFYVYSK